MLQGIQGLIGGSFDYSQMLGQGGGAIMRGAPLKIIMAFDSRPSWFVLGGKNMKTIQDLKGKQLAVSSFGAALDQMTRELLPRFGMEPMRDVILRAIEPPPNRLAALLSGAVDAAVLTHTETIIARRQGFNELIFFGDHIEFVSAGVVATERNISQRPDFVRRFIRGALKTFYWIKANEKEVVARLAKATKSSEADGLELYRTGLKLFSRDGTIPRNLQERMISLQRKVLQVEKEVTPESVYDFSFVRAGNKELGKGDSSMSTLDQPILIANVNYHVGHWVAIYVAEEQGFFKQEGLTRYEYERGGLLPGPSESQTLGLAIKEHGVDIATAVDTESAITQRVKGADVYIVGGWRYTPFLKWYGSKHITDMSKLRGGKIGVRENSADGGGLVEFFIEEALKEVGVNPETEVEMVQDPVFGYRNNPAHIDMLRSGKVNAITSSPPFSDELEREGYPVILDPNVVFPRRPGKVTVAPRRTIEQRSEELKAYFRAITRTFWFMRDVKNFEYLHDLETRLRKLTHNEDEQRLFIASAPDRVDSWALPMDGGIERPALERIIGEMVKRGRLERPIPVGEVFKDDAVREAYRDVSTRGELKPAFNNAMAAVEKYGF